ncbi:hypothetical protein DRN86_05385 [Candidatus Geothermarchaeota archaeon]|nr:MAG: hypothetical protein DRN86_05385 [Candidatus Geothermarchaeota archaeon]
MFKTAKDSHHEFVHQINISTTLLDAKQGKTTCLMSTKRIVGAIYKITEKVLRNHTVRKIHMAQLATIVVINTTLTTKEHGEIQKDNKRDSENKRTKKH